MDQTPDLTRGSFSRATLDVWVDEIARFSLPVREARCKSTQLIGCIVVLRRLFDRFPALRGKEYIVGNLIGENILP